MVGDPMSKRVYKRYKRKGPKVTTRALLDKMIKSMQAATDYVYSLPLTKLKAHTTDRESLYREGFPPEHD